MEVTATQLKYFVAVAEHGHFARAAAALRISGPTLSQQIARLESVVGARLFERSPRSVSLTERGAELLPLAREARRAHAAVEEWAAAAPSRGVLRVGVVAAGAGPVVSRALAEAVAAEAGLSVQVVRLGFFDGAQALRDDLVDVVVAPPSGADEGGVVSEHIATERRVLVVRDDHPLAARASVGIGETDDLPFVVVGAAENAVRAWWLVDPRPSGARPRVAGVADDVEGLLELCAAGIGVNIAAESVATHYRRPGLACVPIDDIEPVPILVSRRRGRSDRAVALFVDAARRAAT
ncbi:LysR family transcriptional regulator [Microbacterium gilvum]|uniref:LysR family transcriptional regulator n=1 Tax=Microbacterium gilvum TaxID=1336204 RepID=A0ABP8ZSN2_9MICO